MPVKCPVERTYPCREVLLILHISRAYLGMLMKRHAAYLSPVTYRRFGRNSRKHRVLTRQDIAFLRARIEIGKHLSR